MSIMSYFQLAATGFLPVVLSVAFYMLKRKTKFGGLPEWSKQLIIGLAFGAASCIATELGVKVDFGNVSAILNVRDAAPICAGLFFGAPAGILAGVIGAAERALSVLWGAGVYPVVACSLGTLFAGVNAAMMHRFMFDGRRPSVLLAAITALVTEVVHLTILLLTHIGDMGTAMDIVNAVTLPMLLLNSVCVGLAASIIAHVSHEFHFGTLRNPFILQTIEVSLLLSVLIAYLLTTSFVYAMNTSEAFTSAESEIMTRIGDIREDISDAADEYLQNKTRDILHAYIENPDSPDSTPEKLAITYGVTEVNIVNSDGIIVDSNIKEYIGYDMKSGEQSAEFMILTQGVGRYVQDFMSVSYDSSDESRSRKYAGMAMEGGFIQVGLDYELFSGSISTELRSAGRNTHIGDSGFIVVLSSSKTLQSAGRSGKNADAFAELSVELDNREPEELFSVYVGDERYLCAYQINDGYYIIGLELYEEAMEDRNTLLFVNSFMEIIVFAGLFVVIFMMIKRKVVDKIKIVNDRLSKITGGSLDEKVDVGGSHEMVSLSNDINRAVETLKKLTEDAEKKIDDELQYAKKIQHSALPSVFPAFPDLKEFDIFASMDTAKEVGGDFYDFYMVDPKHLAFLIADVSGKGIPAAMFMMTAKTLIRSLAENGLAVADLMTQANEKLCENNEAGMFVTAWMGILNIESGELEFVNAGHNPPVLYRAGKEYSFLKTRPGLVLAGMEGMRYRAQNITLAPGDKIFLYTDGVTEATSTSVELFGEERLSSYLNSVKDKNPEETIHGTKQAVDAFAGDADQFDDITMLMIEYKGTGMITETRVYPAEIEQFEAANAFVSEVLENNDAGMKAMMQIAVAFEEMFVNVAHYAYKGTKGDVEIKITICDGVAAITLTDRGTPFNPLSLQDPDTTLAAEDRKIGGLGIFMVKKTMDDVSYRYENDCNIFTMKKKI